MFKEPKALDYLYKIKTIDSHTVGEYTRIVYDGFPELKGETMMDKKHDLQKNYDFLRTALMLEPRGHRDMFGAVLTEPCNKEADFGVIFLDSGGCLNMCGHGSIGVASMVTETGMVEVKEPYTEVTLDTPAGLIKTLVHVVDKKAIDVTITNVPAFLYKRDIVVNIAPYGDITLDVAFGGSFFALVDADKINVAIDSSNSEELSKLGMKILEEVNKKETFKHPMLDITTVDLTEFYTHKCDKDASMKNCVVFGAAQIDRSPCGTGTSAKIATLHAKGELGVNEKFVYESITGSKFIGVVTKEVKMGEFDAVIPKITGSAYITGLNTWLIDEDDPHKFGFML